MRAITKKEAFELYDKLTDLAFALAEAQGTTPQQCSDPICVRWRRLKSIDEIEEGFLLLLTEQDSPLFVLNEKGIVDGFMNGGIMTVPDNFKEAHRDDKMLTVTYTDGIVELYAAQEDLVDVYAPHSSNNVKITVPFPPSAS